MKRKWQDVSHIKPHWYILDKKGSPVVCYDLKKWSNFFLSNKRIVKVTPIKNYVVSTVFLGIDHDFLGTGIPVLWETMIFGWDGDYQERYSSLKEAKKGHNRAVKYVKKFKEFM